MFVVVVSDSLLDSDSQVRKYKAKLSGLSIIFIGLFKVGLGCDSKYCAKSERNAESYG